jgi:hypothetical protein
MVMVAHEAVGVDLDRKPLVGLGQILQELFSVPPANENAFIGIAAVDDVVKSARIFHTQGSGHGGRSFMNYAIATNTARAFIMQNKVICKCLIPKLSDSFCSLSNLCFSAKAHRQFTSFSGWDYQKRIKR